MLWKRLTGSPNSEPMLPVDTDADAFDESVSEQLEDSLN
jgi:hypothetical protein